MSKRTPLIMACLVILLGLTLIVLTRFFPLQKALESGFLEKIETQDPGYLRLPVRILDRSTYEALTFNPLVDKPATLSFRLTKPAEVRIRIFRRDQNDLILRTLLDWTPLKLGRHELKWDGRDASGNITENHKVHFVFEGKDICHLRHKPEKCHDLKIEFLSPRGESATVNSTSEIEAYLVGDRAYGSDSGYTVKGFIDWRPSFKKSYPKETTVFKLPKIQELSEKQHILTLNIDDGHDHVASATLQFYLHRELEEKRTPR